MTVLKRFSVLGLFKVKKNNRRMGAYSLGCVNLTWRLKAF